MSKMRKLSEYMKKRAAFEGVEWELTEAYLQQYFDRGTRSFFGVEIDDAGMLLSDAQQPDFFDKHQRGMRS